MDWDVQSRQEGNVTAYETPLADAYDSDAMNDPLVYLDAYNSNYEEEPVEYSLHTQDEEEAYDDLRNASSDMPEPEAEAEEDPYGYEPDAPKYPDATEDPEMTEGMNEEYDWPDQEDNKKRQRLRQMELQRNYWTRDLGPDF